MQPGEADEGQHHEQAEDGPPRREHHDAAFIGGLAHLPGDPFERLIPFFPAFLVVYFWPRNESEKID